MIRIDKQIQFELIIRNLANLTSQVNTLKNELGGLQNKLPGNDKNAILTYQQQLSKLNKEAQTHYQTWKQTGDAASKLNFDKAVKDFQALNKEAKGFNTALTGNMERQVGYLGSLAQKLRSHFNWIVAGSLITAGAGIPLFIENIAKEVEVLNLKMAQNLELADRYRNNQKGLEEDIKHLSNVAATFAIGYGVSLKDTMEMMQILSRRFKSPEELTYYTNLALIMAKLDFVEPKIAAQNLEAVILSMGLNFQESRRFIDEFSVAVHTARITGTDLLAALQRSGATFKNMNMGTAEAIAMISTLSTVVAKTGMNIGVSLNSLLTNVDFKKGADALHSYKIEVYDEDGKMRKGVEIWRDMARVFNGLKVDDNDEKANKLALALSGGKFRINDLKAILGSWEEFEKLLEKIKNEASPELTGSLLATGMKSYQTELDKLVASLQVLGVVIGNEVMPSLKAMVIGLASGVQYLIDNKEEVAKFVTGLGKFIEVLLAYKATQMLANSALGTFITGLGTAALTAPSFSAGMATMTSSVRTFGAAVMATTLQMAALWAITSALLEMKDAAQQARGEKDYLANSSPGYKDVDDIRLLIAERDRYADMPGNFNAKKVTELNDQIRQKLAERKANSSMDKVQKMVAEAERNLVVDRVSKEWDKVGGQDLSGGSKGGSSTDPTDRRENRIIRDENIRAKNQAFLEIEESQNKYAISLDNLNTKEQLYGNTVDIAVGKIALRKNRVNELIGEQLGLSEQANALQEEIDKEVAKREELQELLTLNGVAYKDLDKNGKKAVLELNKEWFNNEGTLKSNYAVLDALLKKILELKKETNGLINQNDKDILGRTQDQGYQYGRRNDLIGNRVLRELAGVDKSKVGYYYDEIKVKIKGYQDELENVTAEIIRQQAELDKVNQKENPAKYEELSDSVEKLKTKQAQLNATIKDTAYEAAKASKEFWSNTLADLILEGKSFGDVWKGIWRQIAKEAINAMLGIKQQSSILNAIGGKGKAGARTDSAGVTMGGKGKGGKGVKPHTGGVIGISNIPKFHSGGVAPVLSDETMAILRRNEEVNTSGERRSMAMMSDNMAQMMGVMQAMIETIGKNQGGGQPIIINAVDSQSFHDALRRNGESVIGVIREQGYLSNK